MRQLPEGVVGFAQRLYRTASERLDSTRVSVRSGQTLRVAAGGNGYVSPGRYSVCLKNLRVDLEEAQKQAIGARNIALLLKLS